MDRAEQITDRAQSGENVSLPPSVSVLMSDDSIRMVRWWVDWSLHICGIRWVRWVPDTHQPLTLLTPNQPVAFLIACAGHFVLLCCNVTATQKGREPYQLWRPHSLCHAAEAPLQPVHRAPGPIYSESRGWAIWSISAIVSSLLYFLMPIFATVNIVGIKWCRKNKLKSGDQRRFHDFK